LQLNNGSSMATVTVSAGSQSITAPVQLLSNTAIDPAASATLTISGAVSGAGSSLVLDGSGKLVLNGTNTYLGGTLVTAGTLIVSNASALANGSSLTIGAGAASIFVPSVSANPSSLMAATGPATASAASYPSAAAGPWLTTRDAIFGESLGPFPRWPASWSTIGTESDVKRAIGAKAVDAVLSQPWNSLDKR
jgi:autotransporter-associated beta strand protein